MKIALFHYHLRPGGVTDVVVFSIRALLKYRNDLSEVRLVTGEVAGTEFVMSRIRDGLDRDTADKLKLDVLEEIAYVTNGQFPDASKLAARLEARYDEQTLWWIHNYHLGKNPSFTKALMQIADTGTRDMLFHVHDFPECGRPVNLARLDSELNDPPYPTGPRIRYATINERDRRILSDAGIGESVSLLINPVPLGQLAPSDPETLKKALEEYCSGTNPGYIPGAPNLLYPVRAIRRKNVLEAALFARMLESPANLIVTLPGTSDQEKPYSEIVEKAYREGLISGAWCPEASGDERLSYPRLASSCDAVISTSVQEGFGYLFLNALHWQKPLIARYLDVLDGVLDLFGEYPRRFWADFRVPADPEITARTQQLYLSKIKESEESLPAKSVKSMTAAVSKIAAGGGIDMSFLSVEDQLEMLRRAKDDPEWIETTRAMNRELLESAGRTLRARAPAMDRIIESNFGETSFVRNFTEVVNDFGVKRSAPSAARIRESVAKAFGRIDYLRLLYDS